MKSKFVHRSIIITFVSLYLLVSVISTIHVIDFFLLSNPYWLAVSLAIGFELGAAASLASLVILDKMNKTLVWILFGAITLMQMQGNMYHAFSHMENFQSWSELFGLIEEDIIYQKRILAAVSGAILPLVALGFIKSLIDYIKPEKESKEEEVAKEEESKEEKIDDSNSIISEYISPDNEYIESPEFLETEDKSEDNPEPEISEEPIENHWEEIVEKTGKTKGVSTRESDLLPVNSNKKKDLDNKVNINPLLL
jgi:uncharacterized membrane protein